MAVSKDKELAAIEAEDTDIEIDADGNEKEETEDIEKFQGTIFDALIAAAGYETESDEQYTIRIKREQQGRKVILLEFRIHPLSEEKISIIRKRNTTVKRDRRYGVDREKVDNVKMRSQLIYEATVDEDRERIWNDRKAWETLGVVNGIGLIDRVLKAGEKDAIVESIENISGYGNDDELGTLVKN